MTQRTSRDNYSPSWGYLGVYLEEGAPLVDAEWNAAQDIQWHLRGELARSLGLEGAAGDALRPVLSADRRGGALRLRLCGDPRPYYVDGLPLHVPDDVYLRLRRGQDLQLFLRASVRPH